MLYGGTNEVICIYLFQNVGCLFDDSFDEEPDLAAALENVKGDSYGGKGLPVPVRSPAVRCLEKHRATRERPGCQFSPRRGLPERST